MSIQTPEQTHDILTVTLNPALDLSTETDRVSPGPKLRCAAPLVEPGGGGINVSRAVAYLGGTSRAFVAAGGATGARLRDLIAQEGIATVIMQAPGETRQSLAVTDRAQGGQYRFVMPGPTWQDADAAQALASVAAAAHGGGLVVLSGSQPPGVAPDFPARLARALARAADREGQAGPARLIVDTSGASLAALVRGTGGAAPWLLRMDGDEASELAGRPLPGLGDSAGFAAELVARGVAQVVIVARGADGAVLAGAGQRLHVTSPRVSVRSKVGAGDSFVGAFALAVARGQGLGAALQLGNAAASAAVMTEGSRLCRAEDVARLLPDCTLRDLS